MWTEIARHIGTATGRPFSVAGDMPLRGGSINRAWRVEGADGRRFFVKLNHATRAPMFAAEAEGLEEIRNAGALKAPEPVCWGSAGADAYLVLEYLELGGSGNAEEMGRNLARLHEHTADRYGWHRDNTIGSSAQVNTPISAWAEFWRERRLGFQLRLAAEQGYGGQLQDLGERLMADIDLLLPSQPAASLLHGDLWSGNFDFDRSGAPVVFDPAVYYGDRETDLAMTELFGGFSPRFYAAYREAYPLVPGYETRKALYNLYHILNHLNLFGGGYGAQAIRMMEAIRAELH